MKPAWTLAMLVLVAACGMPESESVTGKAREPAPDFKLLDLDDNPVELAALRGKTVILDFWATWCPPCVYQVPGLNQLQTAHADADDLVVIGVSVDVDGVEVVEPWIQEHGVEYTIVMADESLARKFGAQGFPALVAVSPDGGIDSRHSGVIEYDELEAIVAQAAVERPAEDGSSP